ncbi:uncharacterized protein Bfra_007542 [Botrytis fragariae]|uniref:SprT-like domain-containing protein n=1 Tax=Botrytis fragariae TaxID=1964551 RepID=A0A8H6AIZ8_9HELO|nr:uncharacterized protein Bfra_007542 [Botrytis fragariae]KAF5868344.1 hypothetical protein Bfra_007542 [Botrytis fragariae]
MGQIPSKISNGIGRPTYVKGCDAELLRQSRSAIEEFAQERDDNHFPHSLIVRKANPQRDYLLGRLLFRRPLTLNRLKVFKHRPVSLVGAVWKYINPNSKLSPLQEDAVEKWKVIDILHTPNQLRLVSTKIILEKYFHIFDDLFFRGTLNEYVTLITSLPGDSLPGCQGHTSQESKAVYRRGKKDVIECRFRPRSTITIFVGPEVEPLNGEKLKKLFGILVHEMCHAFFHIYSCVGRCCNHGSLEQLGTRRHGVMFQELAFYIQLMAENKDILGFNLNMGRYHSLLHELCDKPDWKGQIDVTRWRFDEEKLTRDLICFNT